jgi:hypothetical protein
VCTRQCVICEWDLLLVTLAKRMQFVFSQKCGMNQECEVETWNPHIFNEDTNKWQIAK